MQSGHRAPGTLAIPRRATKAATAASHEKHWHSDPDERSAELLVDGTNEAVLPMPNSPARRGGVRPGEPHLDDASDGSFKPVSWEPWTQSTKGCFAVQLYLREYARRHLVAGVMCCLAVDIEVYALPRCLFASNAAASVTGAAGCVTADPRTGRRGCWLCPVAARFAGLQTARSYGSNANRSNRVHIRQPYLGYHLPL